MIIFLELPNLTLGGRLTGLTACARILPILLRGFNHE